MDSTIFEKEHFKTLIQFKDYLKFENILYENRISFYSEEISNTNIADFRRYYFLQENYQKIEFILTENDIIPVNENYGVSDLQQSKKIFKIYAVILLILLSIYFGIYFIFKLF